MQTYNFETMDVLIEKLAEAKSKDTKTIEVVCGDQMHAMIVAMTLSRDHGYDNLSLGTSEHSFIVTL